MNIKVLKNILLYGVGDFIVSGVTAFLFIPIYLKFLSNEDYGILNILNNNSTFFSYIFQFGLISAFSRIYFIKKADGLEKEYTWDIMCLHFGYSIILFVLYFNFNDVILNYLSPSISNSNFVYYSPVMAFLTFMPALHYVYLRLTEKSNKFVQYQILTVLLVSINIFLFYLFYEINLKSILISFVLSNFLIWFIVAFNIKYEINFKINLNNIIETLHFASPIFVSYLAYFFISKYGIIILQKHVTLGEIGRYSFSLQIATIPSLVSIAISKAVQPILFSSNCDEELRLRAQKIDVNYKLFMIWLVGSLIFFTDLVFYFFLPLSFGAFAEITRYLLFISLAYNFTIVENTILLYKLKSRIILLLTVGGSLLNIFLSNILIHSFLLNGVLISMAATFVVYLFLEIYFSRKLIKLSYDISTILFSVLFIVVFILISSTNLFSLNNIFKAGYSFVSFFILTIAIGLLLKKNNYDFGS